MQATSRALTRLLGWLVERSRAAKRVVLVVADAIVVPVCLWGALLLKFDLAAAMTQLPPWLYLAAALVAIGCFSALGLYRAVTRYMGFRLLVAILLGASATATATWIAMRVEAPGTLPLSAAVIFGLNMLVWISATRLAVRWLVTATLPPRRRVIIYGAGDAGARLAVLMTGSGQMHPVAYVDEKKSLQNSTVQGIPVYAPEELPSVAERHEVGTILLAIPAASRQRRSEVIRGLAKAGLKVQTVPDLNAILAGQATLADLRDVSVADLLGRDVVAAQRALLGVNSRGKNVLVTGAGGSIGSELCRQILEQRPARLLLFEQSEVALYEIKRELEALCASREERVEIVGLLGNSHHRGRLREIMRAFEVQTVYHAAAYKHVPIVEENVVEGIYNNVFATWHAAEAAVEAGVEAFVLISTDKAVNPTSVMGATKRFAEIVLQAMNARQSRTQLCMVRFGNVLGSSGSVVPLFQEQIRLGGPVTVTHPEVRRYFMTIPEAASLVLQAGAMAHGGEVFLLDMGQPVKIDELARRMVALAGLTVREAADPDGDIEIQYTGLRPGEKLYEELLIGANAAGTEHPMILRAMEHSPSWSEVERLLGEMRAALEQFDCVRARALLATAVREYQPADMAHDLVWRRGQVAEARQAAASAARHLRAVPPIAS
ncbi:MAG: polysaccharide biosynthesis protein [Gammaproteobacteria bacterium]|nr:polysaccharide biosynthesis protein [Gammaproteobacteria bacterium]